MSAASAKSYSPFAKFLHWATVLFVITAWLLVQLVDFLPKESRGLFMMPHFQLGLLVLVALVLRVLWRVVSPAPAPEPTPYDPWANRLAALGHLALYALLAIIPILGILTVWARGRGVMVFGLYELTSPWAIDPNARKTIKGLHELAANALLIIAGLHAVAALVHHYLWHDRTLTRMLPFGRSTSAHPAE